MEETGSESYSGVAWAEESLLPGGASSLTISNSDDDLVSVNELFAKADPAPRQQLPLPSPPRARTSGRSERLYPEMSAQTGLRLLPRRRRNKRPRGFPGGPEGRYKRRHRCWRRQ